MSWEEFTSFCVEAGMVLTNERRLAEKGEPYEYIQDEKFTK